jgi:hypothetical protein
MMGVAAKFDALPRKKAGVFIIEWIRKIRTRGAGKLGKMDHLFRRSLHV